MSREWVRPFTRPYAARLTLQDEPMAPSPASPDIEPDIVEVYSFNTALMVALIILWSSLGHQVARR